MCKTLKTKFSSK